MAATERPSSPQDKSETASSEAKTIFNILSKLKEPDPTGPTQVFVSRATLHLETDDDITILRKDPETKQSTINKTAYLKLHRSLSPNRNSAIELIKKNYENADDEAEPPETLESIKQNYSPTILGYNKPQPARRSKLTRSQIILPAKKDQAKARLSLNIEKNKRKDVNANNVKNDNENPSSDEEFVTIITRSESEESVLKFQKELSAFTMDKKKRANSFRKIFSVFSNKDKKKKQDEKNKSQNKENGEANTLNFQNESNSFSRQAPYRHTTGGEAKSRNSSASKVDKGNDEQLEKDYAQMHINQFNKFKHNFENSKNGDPVNKAISDGYTPMDKPIYKTNEANNTYMNMPNIRKYIDTSSSASTLESDRSNIHHNDGVEIRTYPANTFRPSRISDNRRDTPPRLLETQQDVRLVNPKALIPINSERPLPNPYQNNSMPRNKPLSHSTPTNARPYLNDTYGTVFDSLENRSRSGKANHEKPPRSPVEPSKLKLPPNREIVPLTPRVRSPIPPDNVSTEKIIATELLRPKRSPTPTKKVVVAKAEVPSHQRLEIDIDYPDNINYASQDSLLRGTNGSSAKPPVQRMSQASRSSNESVVLRQRMSPVTTAQVHTNRTPTPNNTLSNQNLSISPIRPNNNSVRPSTPSGSQIPDSPKTTPQKEDMRKSVEAYYWKEIKKLKDQENYELYMYQMQYGHMMPYGFAEDPVNLRRSRSMSPSANRSGRRSLSLPREPRPPPNVIPDQYYRPNAIPENRAVVANQMQPRSVQQLQFQYFQRNAPERSTTDGSPRKYDGNANSLYRPIFKRGSLNAPPKQIADDSLKRKVSFSGAQDQNVRAWPTKNGFTQSPPQRRIDKLQSNGDDEVFFPNNDLPNEEMYYNTRQNIIGFQEPTYVLRASQNSLYIHQRHQTVENPYGQRRRMSNQQEDGALYGQSIDAVRPPGLTRHGSIQIQEELYGQRPGPRRMANRVRPPDQEAQYVSRRPPSQQSIQPLRREVIVNDEIFGQFGGYSGQNNTVRVVQPQNVYASRQSITEYNSRVRDLYYNRPPPKQVSVNNKVCDIYGQIHDNELPKVQQTGVLMGQLQQQSPGSPPVVRSSYHQLAGRDNFVRNNRLTASANDMYRRLQNGPQSYNNETLYGRIEQGQMQNGAPNRPLPPVPQKGGGARNNTVSDNESGSDASEIRKILNNNAKSKKRGIFGK